MRLPRTTGGLSGLIIFALGIWVALILFIGPYFHYGFHPDKAWHWSSNRFWLEVLPGIVAAIAGAMMISAARRMSGGFSGWLAIAAGAWLIIGPSLSLLWHKSGFPVGTPIGGSTRRAVEEIGFFYGPGALIVAYAAFATGRFVSRPRVAEEAGVAAAGAAAEGGRLLRRRRGRREPVADREEQPAE